MDAPLDSTAMGWFPRVYNFHFRILGNEFVNSFPRNGSTCHTINLHMAAFPHCSFDSTVSGILLIPLLRIIEYVSYQIFGNLVILKNSLF
jgi:hypothetical protein